MLAPETGWAYSKEKMPSHQARVTPPTQNPDVPPSAVPQDDNDSAAPSRDQYRSRNERSSADEYFAVIMCVWSRPRHDPAPRPAGSTEDGPCLPCWNRADQKTTLVTGSVRGDADQPTGVSQPKHRVIRTVPSLRSGGSSRANTLGPLRSRWVFVPAVTGQITGRVIEEVPA
jgi:hypothetical protein